jgi:cation transport regulator
MRAAASAVRHRTDDGAEIGDPRASPRTSEAAMPYTRISELPEAQTDQYSTHQTEVFLKSFNNAYKEYGGDESRAFAVAHAAAKKAPKQSGG